MKRLTCAAACVLALTLLPPVTTRASEPYGCLTFEDDSYVCGTLMTTESGDWSWDETKPFVAGCIPGGLCDTEYTDDCPPGLEDVACWEAQYGGPGGWERAEPWP
jgi:hypothetical protein